jgi:glycosyltransferase involved in cell wall biosynthesis
MQDEQYTSTRQNLERDSQKYSRGQFMRKAIVLLTIQFYPDFGGASIRTYNIAKMLKISGFDVYVVTIIPSYFGIQQRNIHKYSQKRRLKFLLIETIDGIKAIRFYIPPIPHKTLLQRLFRYTYFMLISSLLLFHVAKLIKTNNEKIVAVYAHFPPLISYIVGHIYSKALKCSLLIDVHDLLPEQLSTIMKIGSRSMIFKILSLIAKKTYEKATCIISSSSYMAKILNMRYNIPFTKMLFLPTGIERIIQCDKTYLRETLIKIGVIPRQWKNKIILIYTGVIDPPQGIPTIVEAFSELIKHNKIKNLVLLIVGDGKDRETVEKIIKQNKLTDHIKVIGYVPREIALKLICASDIGIVPLRASTALRVNLPTKLFDYLSCGKHVLVISESLELYKFKKEIANELVIFCLPKKEYITKVLTSLDLADYNNHTKKYAVEPISILNIEYLASRLARFINKCLKE